MGRTRSANADLKLFPGLRRRLQKGGERFYYEHRSGRKEPLGDDFLAAVDAWKRLRGPAAPNTIKYELDAFRMEYLPTVAIGTQTMYRRAIIRLVKVFGDCRYDQIGKADLVNYVKLAKAKTRAKRDIACLSSCWSWALSTGRTKVDNPRFGLEFKRTREERQKVQPGVDLGALEAVKAAGDAVVRETLDLLYLSGQDVGVVLGWRREFVHWDTGVLDTTRSKTQHPIRIELYQEGTKILTEFAQALRRAMDRPRKVGSMYIIANDRGQPVSYKAFWQRFKIARAKAGVTFELRAIRRQTGSDMPSLQEAQELLGHADTATTRRHYRHGERVKPLK